MALNYDTGGSGGTDYKPVPAGTHIAICTMVADIGLQPGSAMYPAPKRKLILRFEIPDERVQWKDKDGKDHEGPSVIYERFTATMASKGLLRPMLEAWYGRSFTDEEAKKVDVSKVAGRPAMIVVTHNKSGDRTYANIASVGPLPKSVPPPTAESEVLVYHAGRDEQFEKLPKFVQEKITSQIQLQSENDVDEARATEFADDRLDDVPF